MSASTTDFVSALKKIRADASLSQKFMQNPHATLASLGVHVGKQASAAVGAPASAAVCVGACICVG
jgi:hypothetical protein